MNQDFMRTKPILPLVLSMALPMMLSMLINSLYNIVDSMFVARLGEQALTAVSLVYPLQTLIVSIGVGFGVGINAAVAFFMGAGEKEKADRAASQGLFLSLVHGILDVYKRQLLKLSNKRYHQTIVLITHDERIALEADRVITIEDEIGRAHV